MTARLQLLSENSELDPYVSASTFSLQLNPTQILYGQKNKIRPLTLSEVNDLRRWLENTAAAGRNTWTIGEAILKRRLKRRKVWYLYPLFSWLLPYTGLSSSTRLLFHMMYYSSHSLSTKLYDFQHHLPHTPRPIQRLYMRCILFTERHICHPSHLGCWEPMGRVRNTNA